MAVLKNYTKALMLIFSTLLFSCENSNQSAESSETSENATSVDAIPESNKQIVYRDFFLEEPLENGYRFGMLTSEWNKHLAILAKNGMISNLYQRSYFYTGLVDLSDYIDETTKEGYLVEGIFEEGVGSSDTVVVFRRNNLEIDEQVLVGISFDYHLKQSKVLPFIYQIIEEEGLKHIAGQYPIVFSSDPLNSSDFPMGLGDILAVVRGGDEKEKLCRQNKVFNSITRKTLFQTDIHYVVLEVTEKIFADVLRNAECEVSFVLSSRREFFLKKAVYSKKQSNLRIEDYFTSSEGQKVRDEQRTQELIEKALE